MDHFALPDDALAVAKRQGRVHRNFQGYSTRPDCDVIGLGVSAIGRVGATHCQNAKTMNECHDALAHRQFPTQRGLTLSREELLRRAVIMAILCQGRVEFKSIALSHLVDFGQVFAPELVALGPLQDSGLVAIEPWAIEVTALGWHFVRSVAMVFDRDLHMDRARDHFSRAV